MSPASRILVAEDEAPYHLVREGDEEALCGVPIQGAVRFQRPEDYDEGCMCPACCDVLAGRQAPNV